MKRLNPLTPWCLALLVAVLAGCGGGGSGSLPAGSPAPVVAAPVVAAPPASAASLSEQLETYLAALPAAGGGISVLVMRDGVALYRGHRGLADSTTGVAVTGKTGFRLASVSKPFTAMAVMQLIERGQLSLTDSILDHLPELPAAWRAITVEQLLTHRSGIIDIFNDFWTPAVFEGMTLDGLLTYLTQIRPTLEFTPDTQGDYSNTGYILLAKIIERKTGARFSDHMAENIFKPANMVDSYINDEFQPIKPGDALNYGNLRTIYGHTTYFKGGMAQVSSTDDFLNFFTALRAGRPVSPQTLAQMTTQRSVLRGGGAYGYGFGVGNGGYRHLGEWGSYYTLVSVDTQRDLAWVVLTNSGATGRDQVNAIDRIVLRAP